MTKPKTKIDDLLSSVEAEQQIIGNILERNELADDVSQILSPEHFYDRINASFYELIIEMIASGKPAKPVTVWNSYRHKSEIEGLLPISSHEYLLRMYKIAMAGFAIKTYAEQIIDLYHRRKLVEAMEEAKSDLVSGKPTADITSSLDGTLNSVEGGGKAPHVSIVSAAVRTLERLQDLRSTGAPGGVKIARQRIAERLGSFYKQDLIILAGRPSMGKTALATSLAISAAEDGSPVAFVSAEMSEEALMHRMLSEISGVPYFLLRKPGSLDEEDMSRIGNAAKYLASLPIEYICEEKEMGKIASACRSVKRKYDGIGMVVADYMQIILDEGRTQTERISNVSKNMKQMAKDLDCPVICLSQLSRQVETRDDKRPQLSDLRDSGQIEQDADVVMFCYREHYYLSREMPQGASERVDWDLECAATKNQMDVITAKQRMGPIGTDKIGCEITTNKFWDLGEVDDDDNERWDF